MDSAAISTYLSGLADILEEHNVSDKAAETCLLYASRLLANGLPVIFDRDHLAFILGMSASALSNLAANQGDHYTSFTLPKKSGGTRSIDAPSVLLKDVQRWISSNILVKMGVSDYAYGFVPGRSIVGNARCHVGCECLVNMDIKDFFPSVRFEQVFRVFSYYGYSNEVSYYLSRLCTYKGALPQGSPASPCLSNIVFLKADKRMGRLAESFGATYTRYADDMTISGRGNLQRIIPIIESILKDEGFQPNAKKTRIARKNQRMEVTGLIVNDGAVHVSKRYKREFLQEIYFCRKFGVCSHMAHAGIDKRFYKEHMYGKAYFILMVEPDVGNRALGLLDSIDWGY